MKPKTEKGSEDGATGQLRRRQAKSINFIPKKGKSVCRYKSTNNGVFDLVLQGQTKLFTNSLRAFYYICGIKLQKNGSDLQYSIKNISKPKLSSPTYPLFEVVKTVLTMVQKVILDVKINKFVDIKEILEENLKREFTTLHGKCTGRIFSKLGGIENMKILSMTKTLLKLLTLSR